MKKLMRNWPVIWALALICQLFLTDGQTRAASTTVLVLPFQVNTGPEMPNAARDVPQQIVDQLSAQGLTPVPMSRARAIFAAEGGVIDLAKARALGKASGADLVIYGNFNQLGGGFSMDTRLVPVNGDGATPAAFERSSLLELSSCAAALAGKAAEALGRPAAPAGQTAPGATAAGQAEQGGAASLVPMGSAGKAISDIQVRGLKVMDPDVILMRLTLRKGDTPSADAINEEVKRIWEMGYFNDVQAFMEGAALVFSVSEKPRIDNVIVEGSKAIDADDVLAAMGTKSGNVLNEQLIADDLQKINELYRKDGYYLAKSSYRLDPRNEGRSAVLVITVDEGSKLYITEVAINGLHKIKRGDLDPYMALKTRGILSWFTGSGVLKEEYLERDTNAIAAFGLSQGFVDIQVAAPEVNYADDGIHIIFTVNEGPQYQVRDVKFLGDVIADEKDMLKIVEMDDWRDEKRFFSVSVMQEDTKRLTNYYADQGYAFAEVDTRLLKVADSETPQVDIGYQISKKQKIFVRRLTVDGNSKTRDNVILREMRLGDGDMYEGARLRRSTERLNRLRYFTAVDTELVPTGKDDEVDLKIKVKEDNTGAVMGGIGYSTYYDVGLSASIMERNLFGRGYWLQLAGFFSWRRTSGTLSFTNPRVYDTNLSVANDLYYMHDYWDNFTKDTVGDNIRFSYPIGEYSSVGIGYRLERYKLHDIEENTTPYISDYIGDNWTSAVSVSLNRDTTDSRDRPTRGTISRIWAEYGGGGLGGTDNFIKAVADWQGFLSFNPQNTVHLRLRLGGVFENADKRVPVFERFWLGGMDTIRGYSYSDLSPRDKNYSYDNQIGGDRMGVANLEYIWTFEKELGLALVPFVDGGFNIDSRTMGNDLDKYLVASAGLELRWRSPMGDLRIAYGIPLVKDYDNERENGRVEFSMGQFF